MEREKKPNDDEETKSDERRGTTTRRLGSSFPSSSSELSTSSHPSRATPKIRSEYIVKINQIQSWKLQSVYIDLVLPVILDLDSSRRLLSFHPRLLRHWPINLLHLVERTLLGGHGLDLGFRRRWRRRDGLTSHGDLRERVGEGVGWGGRSR